MNLLCVSQELMLLSKPLRADTAHVILHFLVNITDVALEIGLRAELLLAEVARKVKLLLVQRLDVTIQRATFAKLLPSISSTFCAWIFLYKSLFGSFFYLYVTREKLPKRCLHEKFARKMLMKLTPVRTDHKRSPWSCRELFSGELLDRTGWRFTNFLTQNCKIFPNFRP